MFVYRTKYLHCKKIYVFIKNIYLHFNLITEKIIFIDLLFSLLQFLFQIYQKTLEINFIFYMFPSVFETGRNFYRKGMEFDLYWRNIWLNIYYLNDLIICLYKEVQNASLYFKLCTDS